MENEKKFNDNDDVISLADMLVNLLTIFYKYKLMILLVPAIALVLGLIFYFTPSNSGNHHGLKYATSLKLIIGPELNAIVGYSIGQSVYETFITDSSAMLEALTISNSLDIFIRDLLKTEDEKLDIINKGLKKSICSEAESKNHIFSVVTVNNISTITIMTKDKETGKKILYMMVDSANKKLKEYLLPYVTNLKVAFANNGLLATVDVKPLVIDTPLNTNYKYTFSDNFAYACAEKILQDGSTILSPRSFNITDIDREFKYLISIKTIIFAVGVIFFATIFLAFVLDFFKAFFKDEDRMSKIRGSFKN